MNDEGKLLRLFHLLHGDLGKRFSTEVTYDDQSSIPDGVDVFKDGDYCWRATREELVFAYVTRDFKEGVRNE